MQRTQVYLPDELYEAAKYYAQVSNKNFSELIREGLRLSLEKEKAQRVSVLQEMVGKFKLGGDKEAATKHDEIYLK